MKIALLGVPGTGKTDVAEALLRELSHEDEPFMIIDGYVEQLEQEIDLALSTTAGYIGNLHVALRRESLERQFVNSITCGTLLETAAYTAMSFEDEQQLAANEAEQQDLLLRIEATFRVMASLYMDTFGYDHAFYLPNRSTEPRYLTLDRNLQAAINAFNLVHVHALLEANLDQVVGHALAIVKGEHESPVEGQDAHAAPSI